MQDSTTFLNSHTCLLQFMECGSFRLQQFATKIQFCKIKLILKKMSDTRYWNKEFLIDFLELYQKHTCLWKVKSKEYTNKNLKNNAYAELVELCKNINKDANSDFVKKKIQGLRGAFRKELKKVESSKRSGTSQDSVYVPSLWYFGLLIFTSDQEIPSTSQSNLSEDEESVTDTQDHDENINEAQNTTDNEESRREQIAIENDGDVGNKTQAKIFRSQIKKSVNNRFLTSSQIKKSKIAKDDRSKFLKTCTEALQKEDDEYSAFGINVAAKIRKMDETQRIFAENLISQILCKGALKKLTECTALTEPNLYYYQDPSIRSNSGCSTLTDYTSVSQPSPSPVYEPPSSDGLTDYFHQFK